MNGDAMNAAKKGAANFIRQMQKDDEVAVILGRLVRKVLARAVRLGLNGTAMPGWEPVLPDADIRAARH